MTTARVSVPREAKRGEVIEVRALIQHPMETGFRRTHLGEPIARNIITRFACRYNGTEVFRADFHSAVSANPYISFFTVAAESGTLTFTWTGDNGFSANAEATISVV